MPGDKQPGFWFWFFWMVATALGLALSQAILWLVGGWAEYQGLVDSAAPWIINGVLKGLAIGQLQWLVLRRYVANAGWWVLTCVVGYALVEIVPFGWITFGLFLGGIQWLVLRKHVRFAWIWIPGSGTATAFRLFSLDKFYLVAAFIAHLAFETPFGFDIGYCVLGFVIGAFEGAAMGALLTWLLQHRRGTPVPK